MKIVYLIEDDQYKAERILSFLSSSENDLHVEHFRSYQSGLRAIQKAPPALVLLDMTLPTFDPDPGARQGRPRHLGGYDILRKISRSDLRTKVFVITQLGAFGEGDNKVSFDEIKDRCFVEFPGVFLGAVHFSQADERWMRELNRRLEDLK